MSGKRRAGNTPAGILNAPLSALVPTVFFLIAWCAEVTYAANSGDATASYIRDRGPGVAGSPFGTYIERQALLIFPYFTYSYDHNKEYTPLELGYGLDETYRGTYRNSETVVYLGYGLTDRLALEFEGS